jgi:hypothetical protein
MAKKRDRQGRESERIGERAFQSGVIDPRAFETDRELFAKQQGTYPTSEGDLEAWEDEQKTAPDLFAEASDEDRIHASGEHTQSLDEEQAKERPAIRRR